jgi:hypothetical protein
MDDTFRNVAIGLFAFLGLHGGLQARVQHSAERQVRDSFGATGRMGVIVAPRGFFGLEANDLYEVDIDGAGMRLDRIPFSVFPRSGWKGDIRYLRLRLRNFTLHDIPIREFRAEIPHVAYDLGHAFYRGRLVLRGAGVGNATVTLGAESVLAFIRHKKQFQQILSDVVVFVENGKIVVTGTGTFPLLGTTPFTAVGIVTAREGRYLDLDLEHTVIKLNGVEAPISLLKSINPVVDIEEDLGLKGYFTVSQVRIDGDQLIVTGTSTLPVAPPGTNIP